MEQRHGAQPGLARSSVTAVGAHGVACACRITHSDWITLSSSISVVLVVAGIPSMRPRSFNIYARMQRSIFYPHT